MKDEIGERIKSNFENRTRFSLPRRSYTIIRVDGRSFHTYTKGLKKPFDDDLMADMDETAKNLCQNISGAKLGFVQSDEISILITDFENESTEAWFDNNLQKMCSISASMATSKFNSLRLQRILDSASRFVSDVAYRIIKEDVEKLSLATFDSRVFQIPSKIEVINYIIWRQQDTTRNSILSVAQSLYKHKEIQGKNTSELQEMIFQKGINWNDYDPKYKRGRMIIKEDDKKEICYISEENSLKIAQVKKSNPDWFIENSKLFVKTKVWKYVEIPIFTQDPEFLSKRIPNNN